MKRTTFSDGQSRTEYYSFGIGLTTEFRVPASAHFVELLLPRRSLSLRDLFKVHSHYPYSQCQVPEKET